MSTSFWSALLAYKLPWSSTAVIVVPICSDTHTFSQRVRTWFNLLRVSININYFFGRSKRVAMGHTKPDKQSLGKSLFFSLKHLGFYFHQEFYDIQTNDPHSNQY